MAQSRFVMGSKRPLSPQQASVYFDVLFELKKLFAKRVCMYYGMRLGDVGRVNSYFRIAFAGKTIGIIP